MSGWEKYVEQAAEALDPDVYDEADPHYASQTYRFRREIACKRVDRILAAVGPLIQEDTRDRMVTAAAASLERDGGGEQAIRVKVAEEIAEAITKAGDERSPDRHHRDEEKRDHGSTRYASYLDAARIAREIGGWA